MIMMTIVIVDKDDDDTNNKGAYFLMCCLLQFITNIHLYITHYFILDVVMLVVRQSTCLFCACNLICV